MLIARLCNVYRMEQTQQRVKESESHVSTWMSFTSLVLVVGGWRRKTGFERMHVQHHLYKAKNMKKILLLFTNTK